MLTDGNEFPRLQSKSSAKENMLCKNYNILTKHMQEKNISRNKFYAFGYSLQSNRYGASSSSISGNLPTGGLKRLSVLSSLH